MAQTKEILIDVNVRNSDAVDRIIELQKELDRLKVAELKEEAAAKAGIKTREAADRALIEIKAETQAVTASKREYEKVLKSNMQAEMAQDGSLKQMRAELKNLLDLYDSMSEKDRVEIGGVGEQTLVQIRQLQAELKEAEEASGRFQRSVGSYEDAIKRAMEGTIPMRSALRELRNELQTMSYQNANLATQIDAEKTKLQELANTLGTDSDEYKKQAQVVENLNNKYQTNAEAITDLSQKMGEMDDVIKDANESFANYGKDNANLKAASEGVGILLDGYTALQAGMVALGIESEELMDVFAKIQILQQGLNAVNQIANTLEKQSVFMQQAKAMWTKVTTQSIASLIAAKKAENIETMKVTASEGAEVAATSAVAAGNTAATATSWTLVGALKAVGAAIKSIPVIGWILAAVAALGTLIGLIAKANKESEKGNDIQRQAAAEAKKYNEVKEKAYEATRKETLELEQSIDRLKSLTKGSEEYNGQIERIAKELGLDADWLKKNEDKVYDLAAAWIEVKKAMALADAYNQAAVDEEIKKNRMLLDIENLKLLPKKDQEEAVKKLGEEYGWTGEQVEKLTKSAEKYAKAREKGWNVNQGKQEKAMFDAVAKSVAQCDTNAKKFQDNAVAAVDGVADAQKKLDEAIKASNKTKKGGSSERNKDQTQKYYEDRIKAEKKYNDLLLGIIQESNEKELALLEKSYDDQIKEAQLQQAKILEQIKKANASEKSELEKHYKTQTNQQVVLEAKKELEISRLKDKQRHQDIQKELAYRKELIAAQRQSVTEGSNADYVFQQSTIEVNFKINQEKLKEANDEIVRQMDELKEQLQMGDVDLKPFADAMKIGVAEYRNYAAKQYDELTAEKVRNDNMMIASERAYTKAQKKLAKEQADAKKSAVQTADQSEFNTEMLRRMIAAELSMENEKAVELARIEEERAKRTYEIRKTEHEQLKALSQSEITERYATIEEYNAAVAQSAEVVKQAEYDKVVAMKNTAAAVKAEKNAMMDSAIAVGQAVDKMAQALNGLFQSLSESNDKYNDFATGIAMAQILISSAVSIAQAIQAAVQAGGFTGPAAVGTIPIFIAELVGIVASGIASAVSVLNRAKEARTSVPRFATGGYVGEGRDGVDKVPAMLTKGEYVISKKRVDELGLDVLNKLNFGKTSGVQSFDGYYATGGMVTSGVQVHNERYEIDVNEMRDAMAEAVAGVQVVASVKEINRVQNRIKIKERI